MLEIFAYAIGVMYTPGPINLLGLRSGINGNARDHIGFFIGVGCAMFLLFVFLGFVGLSIIRPVLLPYISLIGCSYILYIAWKVAKSSINIAEKGVNIEVLSFWNGLVLQLLNPKALIATLPIATLQFPAVGISGIAIVFWSAVLALLAFGAPSSYSVVGMIMGRRIDNLRYFKVFNFAMSGLLIGVAISIGYEHGYLVLVS
jgi:threonine/homoserine/homoserine lactone efflux protein